MSEKKKAFAFFVFWIFTTGERKQYVPTSKKILEVVLYYSYGIFRGKEHPVKKSILSIILSRGLYLSIAVGAACPDGNRFSLLGIITGKAGDFPG